MKKLYEIQSASEATTLKFLQENPKCHPNAGEFQNCLATIFFMEMVAKWYAVHDIACLKPHGQQEEPFYVTDDERLSWLEVDFINYIGDLQLSGGRSEQKITNETYEATLLTTRFRYVLTRGFNSDSVESFFSCLRQFNRVDARAAVFSVEKLLKVGILHAAKTGNVPSSSESSAVVSLPAHGSDVPAFPLAIQSAVRELSSELEYVRSWPEAHDELEIAPNSFLAGYLARACDEKLLCQQCKVLLQASNPTEGVYGLMKSLDRGHLMYPTPALIGVCKLTCRASSTER
ncbi:hypothetical protein HPB52_022159 [Rhipicephalus sanguineus]|uniref:Uncharacterized protein n=1 Tax=Rhipicephalus sanguineus TaxID=34632 RepID=A0A9D4QE93_RHISA|nr:hypothetical protein HPB52_022159 [Rhipicephalus sanguineus]